MDFNQLPCLLSIRTKNSYLAANYSDDDYRWFILALILISSFFLLYILQPHFHDRICCKKDQDASCKIIFSTGNNLYRFFNRIYFCSSKWRRAGASNSAWNVWCAIAVHGKEAKDRAAAAECLMRI